MPLSTDIDYKQLLSELIKKQSAILGPDITLKCIKNVPGLTLDEAGNVIHIEGDPKELLNKVINEFFELSGRIMKETMESVLANYLGVADITESSLKNTPSPQIQIDNAVIQDSTKNS